MAEYIDREKIFPNGVFYVNAENPEISLNELINRICDLPTANVIPIHCKVGDEVWTIRSYSNSNKAIKKGKVSEMYYIDESMRLCIVVKGIARGEWGKVVFPSYESAQEFLDKQ